MAKIKEVFHEIVSSRFQQSCDILLIALPLLVFWSDEVQNSDSGPRECHLSRAAIGGSAEAVL